MAKAIVPTDLLRDGDFERELRMVKATYAPLYLAILNSHNGARAAMSNLNADDFAALAEAVDAGLQRLEDRFMAGYSS